MKLYSVTEVLSPWSDYSSVPPDRLAAAAERGKRIHAAAAAKLTGTFLVVPLHPEDAGLWESLSSWMDSEISDVFDVEPELIDEKMGFIGHPDLLCCVRKRYCVVDWKTPQTEQPTWKIQLGAYVHLAIQARKYVSPVWRGMAVQPHPEGKPAKATPYLGTAQDLSIFLSALNAYRYFNQTKEGKNDRF